MLLLCCSLSSGCHHNWASEERSWPQTGMALPEAVPACRTDHETDWGRLFPHFRQPSSSPVVRSRGVGGDSASLCVLLLPYSVHIFVFPWGRNQHRTSICVMFWPRMQTGQFRVCLLHASFKAIRHIGSCLESQLSALCPSSQGCKGGFVWISSEI